MDQPLIDAFLAKLPPRSHILDLGAGVQGKYARMFARRGHAVTAVEKEGADPNISGVRWVTEDIRAWLPELPPSERYDALFLRNILQFFDADYVRNTLFPELLRRLAPGGVIAVETFYAEPDPAFIRPFASLWSKRELRRLVSGLEIADEAQVEQERESVSGAWKTYRVSQVIAGKPSAAVAREMLAGLVAHDHGCPA